MITHLEPLKTRIAIINNIPKCFFRKIETSISFGNHLFPNWVNVVYATTDLHAKFEAVYNKYKAIKQKRNRDKIINAFTFGNQIKNLCNNTPDIQVIEINAIPKIIVKEIEILFKYLYKTAINYSIFNNYVNDTIRDSINRFINKNSLEVCPFCGLEGFLNIEGQARSALDHWLCQDLFPFSSVNFANLFPIGSSCNGRPAKSDKNILIDSPKTKNRIIAYYPYMQHSGISTHFNFINEPNINTFNNIPNTDWSLTFPPNDPADQSIYDSWISIMNITIRYHDYIRQNIFGMWESRFKRFIENHPTLNHAQTVQELRQHFKHWKASFDIKAVAGSILYISFIDYLIYHASDAYLYGLCENFKR